MKWQTVLNNATDDLRDWMTDNRESICDNGLSDTIHEIADSAVPIYHGDLLDCAAENNDIALREPEILAFDGTATPINVIAGNCYELICEHLHAAAAEIADAWNEE